MPPDFIDLRRVLLLTESIAQLDEKSARLNAERSSLIERIDRSFLIPKSRSQRAKKPSPKKKASVPVVNPTQSLDAIARKYGRGRRPVKI